MSKIKYDTKKMYDAGETIIELTKEFDEFYKTLYEKLERISNQEGYATSTEEGRAWFGKSADEFILKAKLDELDIKAFSEELRKYGNILMNQASSIESDIEGMRWS